MSVPKKILLCVLAVIVIILACIGVYFRDIIGIVIKNPDMIPYVIENWDSLSRGLKADTSDLELETKQNVQNQAQAFVDSDINLSADDIESLSGADMTEEERARLIYEAMTSGKPNADVVIDDENDGTPTDEKNEVSDDDVQPPTDERDEAVENVVTEPVKADAPTAEPSKPTPPPTTPKKDTPTQSTTASGVLSEDEYNTKVSELVAKMYSIKADFMGKLTAFESRIIADYKAMPEEQRTTATKAKIVADNMSYIVGLEAQCDAQVDAVTSELTKIMTANGKDTALVDQIKSAYTNEKELKKAYYVSLYK